MCALLIGGQYVFSFVVGVEIVTLLLVCFSCVFGVRRGVLCAVAFSLLRCFIFGFYPSVIVLYLIYYSMLAAVFGGLGHIEGGVFEKSPAWLVILVNLILIGIGAACVFSFALNLIKVSKIYKPAINIMLWVIFGLFTASFVAFNALLIAKKMGKGSASLLRLISFTAIAAVCTIIFTLLDDVITPLFFGYTRISTMAYFYSSFTAMLPQTICTVVTVGTFFIPLTDAMYKVR